MTPPRPNCYRLDSMLPLIPETPWYRDADTLGLIGYVALMIGLAVGFVVWVL